MESIIGLIAVGLAAWLAKGAYYKQKEYELIRARYLDGGLDHLSGDLENVASIFAHNWARCLDIIKSYRDVGQDFDLTQLEKGFVDLQASSLQLAALNRIVTLTDTPEYWQLYQHATAFYTSANSTLVKEVPEAIRLALTTDRVGGTVSQVAEHAFNVALQLNKQHIKYIALIQELQILSTLLESERFTLKSIKAFAKKKEVSGSAARIKSLLADIESESDVT